MNRLVLCILCLVTLYGCSYTQTDDASHTSSTSAIDINAQTYIYECADNYSFVARIESSKAWLFLPGKTVELEQAQSASGTKYSNGIDTFWSKDDEAMIETGNDKHAGCKNNRAKAIWEHAKLNGVDFRALGNEPGWYMEISNKRDILLVTDYGQKTYRFTSAIINSKADNRTSSYHAHNNGNALEIIINGTPCQDSMSGEAFSASVSVLVNSLRYTGCGRALH